jgi:hypothetical protein
MAPLLWYIVTIVSEATGASVFMVQEAAGSSETLVPIYHITRRHTQKTN